jgi:hypothetical protein
MDNYIKLTVTDCDQEVSGDNVPPPRVKGPHRLTTFVFPFNNPGNRRGNSVTAVEALEMAYTKKQQIEATGIPGYFIQISVWDATSVDLPQVGAGI